MTEADWLILAWSITFPVYLAWTLWSWAQARLGVSRPAVFMYLVPVIAGAVSWLLIGETFGPLKVLGALIVLAGVAVSRIQWPSPRAARSGDTLMVGSELKFVPSLSAEEGAGYVTAPREAHEGAGESRKAGTGA